MLHLTLTCNIHILFIKHTGMSSYLIICMKIVFELLQSFLIVISFFYLLLISKVLFLSVQYAHCSFYTK